ncbi:hypothetical protein AVEN_98712-1 [Araneus ventricosus]|uniref:Uncharacterized protein n=1 Tax=Araneus ventricosus TaxID=182803 RepID=A0A4Y2HG09_ARAVE|nr:hypothetical protein AVEN_98712-1 [Araneus ventricosus]
MFSHHCLKRTLNKISVWNPDCVPNLGCMGVSSYFLLELLQQFLSFASSMGIVMVEEDTITQHAKFASDGFKMGLVTISLFRNGGTLIYNKAHYLEQGSLQTVMCKQLQELVLWAGT